MGSIPGIKEPKFYEKKAVVECFAIIPPIIAAIAGAIVNLADPQKRWVGGFMVAGIVWLIVASILKVLLANAQDKDQKSKQDYDGFLGALHVLYGQVSKHFNVQGTAYGQLRITIHRVVDSSTMDESAEELEQLLPYIGGAGKPAGRKFSVRSGIIGKAVREKTAFAFSRQSNDHEEFIKELVREWSYTEDDARKLTSDRQAWMAVPIFRTDSSVIAVVYLDSNQRNFFSSEVKKIVIDACSGITSYIDERYK